MRCYFNRLNVRLNIKIEARQVWGLNPREDWHLKCCHWIIALHIGWGHLLLGGVSPLKEGKTGTSQLGLWTISLLANLWSRPDVNFVKKVYCPTPSFTVESLPVFKTPAELKRTWGDKPEKSEQNKEIRKEKRVDWIFLSTVTFLKILLRGFLVSSISLTQTHTDLVWL